MSADLYTELTIRGEKEELFAMLKVLRDCETIKKKQYQEKRDCGYLDGVYVEGDAFPDHFYLEKAIDEELLEYLNKKEKNEYKVEASGPWGYSTNGPDDGIDPPVFMLLAEAAPNAYFKGEVRGFVGSCDIIELAELKKGKLYCSGAWMDPDAGDDFYDLFMEKLPCDTFCDLFKIDRDKLAEKDEDIYSDFAAEMCYDDFPECFDYDMFDEWFGEYSNITKKEFNEAIKSLKKMNLSATKYRESMIEDMLKEKSVYDPVTREWL